MSTEQQHLHTAAVSHIRQCFNRINQQVEQAGKEVAAYYFYLVDDFFCRRQRRHYPSRLSCLCRRARRRI
ncbi:hypothetical protein [Eikenella corrodens]|uniref:hypothetical protein n=1 Tax=Eikenella corrodens TaxID=539 RepID=UPI000A8C4190|nr:hypothetical protein [Eikenella corrodens]